MRFSIIVPVYNVADELPRTMKSLLSQTLTDYEIVLVDDGSTDGSRELVDSFAAVNVKVVHQGNQGVVAARQRGFDGATGDWILFVDGDDELCADALAALSRAIEANDCEIVNFGYTMIRIGGETKAGGTKFSGCMDVQELVARMSEVSFEPTGMCIWNKCYRREIVAKAFRMVGDVRISHSEDGLFAHAALLSAKRMAFVNEPLYVYILRAGSAVHRVNADIVEEKVAFIDRMIKISNESGLMSLELVKGMREFLSYAAVCYIVLMLKRNRASLTVCYKVLGRLRQTDFYLRPNSQVCSMRRRLMYAMVRYPLLYVALKWLLFK